MDVFVWGVGYRSSINIQVQDLEQGIEPVNHQLRAIYTR